VKYSIGKIEVVALPHSNIQKQIDYFIDQKDDEAE
jgi:hypothetical protein